MLAAEQVPAVADGFTRLRFDQACEAALSISGRGNQYLEETAPWTAFKKGSDEQKVEAAAVLAAVLEAVRVVAVLLSPVTPSLSSRIYQQLGFSQEQFEALSWADTDWGTLQRGHATPQPVPVLQRLEGDLVAEPQPAAAAVAGKP